ncbi:radical SAM family heme chaperone HemW [Deinococcus cellulosilyticus]|uniref:Heme chaperone HemW n=1 Tax=Deinococcus cellulosilyticus (strain DSM 18568 / NBRC 106333 / KACC 11606 / 5516J-15) TaxID=1223518 RepID=A0A511NAU2_DEIC1|nr:radical SAM family heme chaperone HemW [Deinococcus cellulosilyticus]GEM49930.1 coproporphyrinogen III oxidase [Deinococcus cellulosilyticus NBRC 106333 = KACC 11606]
MLNPVRHLYLHVPFCPTICPYCDFHVLTRKSGMVDHYLRRMREEAQFQASRYNVDLKTVYFGGGTPSFLRDPEMTDLVDLIRTHLGWGTEENTLEINPGTVTRERAQLWKDLGFDRASVGVQSLNDETLKFLGRHHNAKQARTAIEVLLDVGFRVSGDLITAVPGQDLEGDIAGLIELGVEHISAYTLTIEEGTEFFRRGVQVREEDERRGFDLTAELLTAQGFERYEISNYARPRAHSRHNLAYWTNQHYLGLGPGAAGHYPTAREGLLSERITNPRLHDWLQQPFERREAEEIAPPDFVTDALFMGLRLRNGVDLADLSRRSGLDVWVRYQKPLKHHIKKGLLLLEGQVLKATDQGRWVLNQIIADCLEVDSRD